jgi:putative SOS response-associated peptidase YedK
MCGRFFLIATPAEMRRRFKVDHVPDLVLRYNIAPAQLSPIVRAVEKGRSMDMARWGLVPSWSRDLSLGAGMINAPAETLEAKAAYRTAFQTQRCLVPTSGYYEWQTRGAKNQPHKIALRNGALLAFAGLWETWAPEIGEPVETFTIITTQANKLVSEVHDRMPVIIAPADFQRWLTASANTAKKLLAPYTSGMTIAPGGQMSLPGWVDVSARHTQRVLPRHGVSGSR